MPVIVKEESIAANATLDNLISGSAFEFLRGNAVVSAAMLGSATGLVATVQSGSDIVSEEAPLKVGTVMPTIPDDFFYNDVGVSGDRVVIRVRNTTGGALTVRAIIQITPI